MCSCTGHRWCCSNNWQPLPGALQPQLTPILINSLWQNIRSTPQWMLDTNHSQSTRSTDTLQTQHS